MIVKLTAEQKETLNAFRDAVNMTPRELEIWLQSEESQEVGWKGDDGQDAESVGHQSGEHLLGLLRKRKGELTDEDFKFMDRVVGYVHRHSAQRPEGDVSQTRWAHSLKNWGHDPVKVSAPVPVNE